MQARLLQAHDVPDGELILWFASEESRRATFNAPNDERPLTADQLVHFDAAANQVFDTTPNSQTPAPWIGLSCFLAEATLESIATTLHRYFARHEIMRSIFDADDFGSLHRSLLPAHRVSFRPVNFGTLSSPEAHNRIARHLARETRCTEWPYAGFATVFHDSGASLYAAFDHMVFDGYSMYISLNEFPTLHDEALAGTPTYKPAASHADYAVFENEIVSKLHSESPEIITWRSALTPEKRLPGLPIATGVEPDEEWPHEFVSFPLLTSEETQSIREQLRHEKVTTGLGFLSAIVSAIAENEPNGAVDFLMSTHNRPNLDWASSVGWYAGVTPFSLKLEDDSSMASSLLALNRAWARNRSASFVRMPEVARRLGCIIEPSLVLSFMEGRQAPGFEKWGETQAQALLGPTPPGAQIHLWVNCMPDGTHLEVRYPRKPSCRFWIDQLALRSRELLRTFSGEVLPVSVNSHR